MSVGVSPAWALLAAGLLALPTRRAGSGRGRRRGRGMDARAGPRFQRIAAVVLVAAALIALFGVPAGAIAALVGCPLVAVALRTVQLRPAVSRPDRALALCLDLTAAALYSGQPLAESLAVAAPVAAPVHRSGLIRVAGLLRLGADAEQAWQAIAVESPLRPVAVTAVRSAESGIRLAQAFERLATEIRTELAASAAMRAHRAGVSAMAPLGACFLPSFVCLGVVPVLVGVAGGVAGVLP